MMKMRCRDGNTFILFILYNCKVPPDGINYFLIWIYWIGMESAKWQNDRNTKDERHAYIFFQINKYTFYISFSSFINYILLYLHLHIYAIAWNVSIFVYFIRNLWEKCEWILCWSFRFQRLEDRHHPQKMFQLRVRKKEREKSEFPNEHQWVHSPCGHWWILVTLMSPKKQRVVSYTLQLLLKLSIDFRIPIR